MHCLIGFLGGSSPAVDGHRVAVFVQRLRELGWIEGRTVAIDVQWAQGRAERFAEIKAVSKLAMPSLQVQGGKLDIGWPKDPVAFLARVNAEQVDQGAPRAGARPWLKSHAGTKNKVTKG
jgi:putative ABC transport system substrate-binding protein